MQFDILDQITDTPKDWSDYVKSYEVQLNDVAVNNYITYKESPDTYIQEYNKANTVPWGGGNIEVSDATNNNDNNLFTFPFIAVRDGITNMFYNSAGTSLSGIRAKYVHPFIPLIKLSLGDSVPFSASVSGGLSVAAWFAYNGDWVSDIVYVDDTSGFFDGYYIPSSVPLPSAAGNVAIFTSDLTHAARSFSGDIYSVSLSGNKGVSAILIALPAAGTINTTNKIYDTVSGTNWRIGTTIVQTYFLSYFNKPVIGVGLDTYVNSLSVGAVNDNLYINQPLKDRYYSRLTNIISNPPIRAKAVLPEKVFQSHMANELVYLNLHNLNGIFYVDSIENYVDSSQECDLILNRVG